MLAQGRADILNAQNAARRAARGAGHVAPSTTFQGDQVMEGSLVGIAGQAARQITRIPAVRSLMRRVLPGRTIAPPGFRGGLVGPSGAPVPSQGLMTIPGMRAIGRRGAILAGGGAAFEGGARALRAVAGQGRTTTGLGTLQDVFQGGGGGGQIETVLASQGGVITRVWQPHAAGPVFARLDFPGSNRRTKIIVQRLDGTLKTYTPARHIVVSRNPRIRNLTRAATRLDKLTAGLVKAPRQTKRAKDRVK